MVSEPSRSRRPWYTASEWAARKSSNKIPPNRVARGADAALIVVIRWAQRVPSSCRPEFGTVPAVRRTRLGLVRPMSPHIQSPSR